MRLEKVVIQGFRSIAGDMAMYVRPNLTCLVGANEHGKTNILDAIKMLAKGKFQTNDEHVPSTGDEHPALSYTLRLSSGERRELITELEADLTELQAEPESEQRTRSTALRERAIESLGGTTDPPFTIDLRPDSSRLVRFGGMSSPLSHVTSTVPNSRLQKWFASSLPTVFLFEAEQDLVDHITLPELRSQKNLAFEGLLRLAGAWDHVEDLFTADNNAHRLLTLAGRRLTRRIRAIWSQGAAHKFALHETGGNLHVSIEDPTTFDVPSRRSLGFRSFFSFYLTIYARTLEIDPGGFILLFDEPGIHLHPQGQKDLVRELRRLSLRNQVVYSAHSPFMLDRNDPGATLLVKKGARRTDRGTHIVSRPYGENWTPLNNALGISPADTFLLSDSILLVEGRSDRLYVNRYMALCKSMTGADLNYFSMYDCERRDLLPDYIRMFLSNERELVILADGDQGGDNLAKKIRRTVGSKRDQIEFLDLRKLLSTDKDVSFEDALPTALWLQALRTYSKQILGSEAQLDAAELRELEGSMSRGRAAAEYLTRLGVLEKASKFSKTTVADLFCILDLPSPSTDEPLYKICLEITQHLHLSE